MKKFLIGIAVFLLLFSACNLSVPETVSVKTNANYNYSIGNISQDFSDTFQAENLFGDLETEQNKIYDFFPGQEDVNLQQYLLTIKVDDVDLPSIDVPAGTPITLDIPVVTVDFDISAIFSSIKEVLGESFVKNADFREVPLYIYCAKPSGFGTSELKGTVTVKYKADDGSDTSATDVTVGDTVNVIPYFPKPELNITDIDSDGKTFENVIDTSLNKSEISIEGDLKKILNGNKDKTGKIQLLFNLNFSGITNGEAIGKLDINAFIIIPLKFDISAVIDIDLKSLAKDDSDKSNEDVFNRTEKTDTEDIQKYLDVIEKIYINYTATKNPIITDSNTHYVIKSEMPYLRKKLDVNQDSLRLSNEELMEMLSVYPFNPELNFNVPSGAILSLPRNLGLVLNMNISLYTNGVIKVID